MMSRGAFPENMVFGLDIGTRSIVGTVGYMDGNQFVVMAQHHKEHQTRSMLDGQIHDIAKVGATIREVKEALETELGITLTDVCIAAAGRVLKTINAHAEHELPEDTIITEEDIYSLESLGVEKAYEELQKNNETDLKFYCVGYSVVKYYMNGFATTNLLHHKARSVALDTIATFLPDDVVEGLYAAVKEAGLEVANLTLEPIAAIRLAIPEKFRMLNIALIDVGAGTSDISITRDGSIVAYGMIPCAGDSLTEVIAKHCLIDFATAERIKQGISESETISYEDVMGLPQKIKRKEVLSILKEPIHHMAQLVTDEIKRLNGGISPSAVFVVGGGGKIAGYTDALADNLEIAKNRVALRGKEIMDEVNFCEGIEKDPLLVTPLGICLCYYEQNNNFMFVNFNGDRIKLFDNRKLTVMDAVMQVQYPSDGLFPRRGKALTFTINGKERIVRGELGESAVVTINDEVADINYPLHANDRINIQESTPGADALLQIERLPEYNAEIKVNINQKKIVLPKFASVNGRLQPGTYEIQENDRIEMLDYYTVAQIATFLDINIEEYPFVSVNNLPANMETEVYENFTVQWRMEEPEIFKMKYLPSEEEIDQGVETEEEDPETQKRKEEANKRKEKLMKELAELEENMAKKAEENEKGEISEEQEEESSDIDQVDNNTEEIVSEKFEETDQMNSIKEEDHDEHMESAKKTFEQEKNSSNIQDAFNRDITIIVNKKPVTMHGKSNYMFVDIFDYIDFDTSTLKGSGIATMINGREAQYTEELKTGDKIEVYWKDK